MAAYKLSQRALRDVAEIVTYLHRESTSSAADDVERQLFAAFSDLASGRVLGHPRTDLTDKKVLFHYSKAYAIVHRRTRQTILVARVIHASRDLRKLI